MRTPIALAVVGATALACSSPGRKPASAEVKKPVAQAPVANATTTPAASAVVTAKVIPAPTDLGSNHIFDGRVLTTATGSDVFCLSSYFDSAAGKQRFSVDLESCSYTEDEVAVEYVSKGSPTRAQAEAELASRFPGCLEKPMFLPMVAWPSGQTQLSVPEWDLKAKLDGPELELSVRDAETGADPYWTVKIPDGHRIESIHLSDIIAVVRTTGSHDGKPVAECHRTDVWDGNLPVSP